MKRNHFLLLTASVILLVPSASHAQGKNQKKTDAERQALADSITSAPQTLSLEDAVAFALEHNKNLQTSRLNVDLQQKMVMEAISQGLPQINGSMGYQTNFGESLPLGGMEIRMKDNLSVGVSVSQMVFNGQWIVGIQTSKIARTLAGQQADIDALEIKSTVHNSYYTVLICERLRQILKENLASMEEVLQHTQNMYQAGTVEITDVDQIRITVGQLNNSLLSMERTLDVNYNLLRIQLGLKAGTPITLTDSLEYFLSDPDFFSSRNKTFDINQNLDYQATLTQETLQKKNLSSKKWAFAPSLSASYNYQYQIIEGGFMNIPHTATVNLSVPIFSGMQRKSQLDQARISLQQTQLNKSLVEDQLLLEEAQYRYDLQNASDNYDLQRENVEVAKSVLDHYTAKYEVGAISSLDLTQANNNYLQAENNFTSACLDLLEARIKLLKLYNEL